MTAAGSKVAATLLLFVAVGVGANPYPDPSQVPKDVPTFVPAPTRVLDVRALRDAAVPVLRVDVEWTEVGEAYEVVDTVLERSGTEALVRRTQLADPFGSYRGELVARGTHRALFRATVGTGSEFRRLTRGAAFRFPLPPVPVDFRLIVEDPATGALEEVLRQPVTPPSVAWEGSDRDLEVRLLQAATETPALAVNVYAEGYDASKKERFFQDAAKVADALVKNKFPGFPRFELRAVWFPSNTALGKAKDLGLPVADRDSFLGLYFPYWRPFGRWYNVVYPTREIHFRDGLAKVPYDYPIALVDDAAYWGVGNFMELTAIPARNASFTYLLLHEMGHFFGLNEEYEGGGPTELAFATGIDEPWSQNITFERDKSRLKWSRHVAAATKIPTPSSAWTGSGPFGAYAGGYADSEPQGKSHKPGFHCTMENGRKFCPICQEAIEARVGFDLGTPRRP